MKSLRKKLFLSILAVAFAVVSLGTSTFAWFVVNNEVAASGMTVQAKSEEGIVISNEAKSTWSASADASHASGLNLLATSTADAALWGHANSVNANSHAATGDYTFLRIGGTGTIVPITETNGVGSATVNDVTSNLYLVNKFYVQSASALPVTLNASKYLAVKNVQATLATTGSQLIDLGLRVLIKVDSTVVIYAPVEDQTVSEVTFTPTVSYNVRTDNATPTPATTEVTAHRSADEVSLLSTGTIAAFASDGSTAQEISVYIYFEGEDANMKSANLASTLDQITVSLTFFLKNA